MNEAFEDVFSFDSRAWRTLFALLLRPGFLSLEYFNGRRARYVQPIRLYFISSILFFVLLTVVDFFSLTELVSVEDQISSATVELDPNTNNEQSTGQVLEQTRAGEEPAPEGGTSGVDDIDISVPFVSAENEIKLKALFQKQIGKAKTIVEEDPGAIVPVLLELSPPVIFCLLPLFALLLKLLYIGQRFYYAEHLVLALHSHSFVFMWITIYTVLELLLKGFPAVWTSISWAFAIWVPLYLWLSLKTVLRQGAFVTSFKFLVLGMAYVSLLGMGIGLALLIGLLTL